MPTRRLNYTSALKKWAGLWRTPDLPERVRISFSSRLRKSLGRVRRQSGVITLNAGLMAAPRRIVLEVLCHEAAHIAAFLLHGLRAKPHGPEWRELVATAGYQPTTELKCRWVPQTTAKAPAPRHHYRCPSCQADYFVRGRDSRLHCSACLRTGVTVRLDLISPP